MKETTPNEDLRELIKEWKTVSQWGDRDKMSDYQKGLKDATKDKAEELEQLINTDG